MDTLGNNDYVNIYTFSNTTDPLVECFDNILVQVRLYKVYRSYVPGPCQLSICHSVTCHAHFVVIYLKLS